MRKNILTIVIVAFALNFIWENLQAPLYAGYSYQNFWQHFPMCLIATIGDTMATLLLYGVLGSIHKNFWWLRKPNKWDFIFLVIAGGLITIAVEKISIGRYWTYTAAMPLIPLVKVGFTPFLQLIILPIFTFWLANKITTTYDNHKI
jgi:hypothetical protein